MASAKSEQLRHGFLNQKGFQKLWQHEGPLQKQQWPSSELEPAQRTQRQSGAGEIDDEQQY